MPTGYRRDAQPAGIPKPAGPGTAPGGAIDPGHTIADQARLGAQAQDRGAREGRGGRPKARVPKTAGQECDLYLEDKNINRRKTIVLIAMIALLSFFSFCLSYDGAGSGNLRIYSPADVIATFATAARLMFGHLFHTGIVAQEEQIIGSMPYYNEIMLRAGLTVIALGNGLLLSVAGMLFQNTFKNPIASPTMLGIGNGESIGLALFIIVFQGAALNMTGMRYLFCFIGGTISLALVLVVGKATGGEHAFNIVNMLLVGSILAQLIGALIPVLEANVFTSEMSQTLYQIQGGLSVDVSPATFIILFAVIIATVIPLVAFRFRFNYLLFTDEEIKMSGIDPSRLRVLALFCGSLMILTAQSQIGSISVLSLVAPFIARAIFGSEFRRQFLGSVLIGMFIVLLCQVISALIPFVGEGLSLDTIANLITLPFFAWITAANQKMLDR